jgi:hypothetical protein
MEILDGHPPSTALDNLADTNEQSHGKERQTVFANRVRVTGALFAKRFMLRLHHGRQTAEP